MECVVGPDGTVGDVQVVKSLDKEHGLDDEAVKAAKQWRFNPGRRDGKPVSTCQRENRLMGPYLHRPSVRRI